MRRSFTDFNRREFLRQSALVSLAPLVPAFLARSVVAADAKPDDRTLIVIQLDGGNDGLNTVVPFADELYARHRKELRIKPQEVLKLDANVGLHPQMKPAADLFESGRLAHRPGGRISQSEPFAFREHGDLASRLYCQRRS